jgi:hypothetical protein
VKLISRLLDIASDAGTMIDNRQLLGQFE